MLPVLATVLVIVAGGAGRAPWAPEVALRHPVALWLGRHSYAIYLWHWPVLVLAEARYGPQPLAHTRAAHRRGDRLGGGFVAPGRRPRASLAVVGPACRLADWHSAPTLCLGAVLVGGWARTSDAPLDSGEIAAAPTLAPQPTALAQPGVTVTTGAPTVSLASLGDGGVAGFDALLAANRAVLEQGLSQTDVPSNLRPALRSVNADRAAVYADDCVAVGREDQLDACRYGVAGADFTVVLYGDSHAAQWFPALEEIALDREFELVVMLKGGCPTAAVSIPTATLARTCPIWQRPGGRPDRRRTARARASSARHPAIRTATRSGPRASTPRCDGSCPTPEMWSWSATRPKRVTSRRTA